MAEYSPMMQHYLDTKKIIKIVFYFIDWVTFMRCFFLMMQFWLQRIRTDSYWKGMRTRRKSTNVWGTISCSGKLYSTLNK